MKKNVHASVSPVYGMLKNGSNNLIRSLNPEDGQALIFLYEKVPPEDQHFYAPQGLSSKAALQKIEWITINPRFKCLVMETADKQIGGYCWFSWEKDDSRESVFGICIRKDFQGLGAGKLLMTHLLEIAKKAGPPIMSLTVQLANNRAIALYKNMGFKVIRAQLRQIDDEPEYYMEKAVR